MAGVLASLNVKIGADISAFQRGMRDINRDIRKMSRDIEDVGRGMTRAFTVPIGLVAGASIKMAGDFEKSMNRVKALSGATGEEFEHLRSVAKKLGAETQFSATQAAEGLSFLAMAGFSAAEAAEALPGVLDLAAAGAIDLGRAADIASNILSGFALEIKELPRLNDVLTKTFTSTNTSLEQLGEAFQYVGPVASSAGLSIEETAAAIGLLGNAGIQGSSAGTALRGVISRLLSPAGEAAATLDRLGVNAVTSTGKLRSLRDIVDQLRKSGATTADFLTIFGDRAGPGMAALVSQGADALEELTNKNINSAGTAAEIAATQMEGFHGQMEQLRSAAEGLAISIGEAGLLSKVTGLAKSVTSLVQRLNETSPEVLNIATNIGLVTAAIGPALLGLAAMIRTIGTLRKALLLLNTTLTVLNTVSAGWLGTLGAIGAIAAPLLLGIRNGLRGINEEIKDGAGQLETLAKYEGRGGAAYRFQASTGLDRSITPPDTTPYSQAAKEIKDVTDVFGLFGDQVKENIGPLAATNEELNKTNQLLDDLDRNTPVKPVIDKDEIKRAKDLGEGLDELMKAAILASREVDLQRLSTPVLGDITTARERITTEGLEVDDFKGLTAAQQNLANISAKVNENIATQNWHWRDMVEAIPSEAIYMAADAFGVMADNMARVAEAGGTFSEVASEIRKSAISIIGSMIRQGVASVVSGTLTKSSFLGPFAVPLGLAAGALAQGAFNSILNSIKVPAFAAGGIAFGPTLGLFGEYSNAATNPEVVAPLDRLRSLMGGTSISVEVIGKISGRDIQLANERNNIISSRLKGR